MDTITAIKKALEGDPNKGLTAVDRLRLLSGGKPDFDPLTAEDAEWIENALKLALSTLESLQRKNAELREVLKLIAESGVTSDNSNLFIFQNAREVRQAARAALYRTGDTHGN